MYDYESKPVKASCRAVERALRQSGAESRQLHCYYETLFCSLSCVQKCGDAVMLDFNSRMFAGADNGSQYRSIAIFYYFRIAVSPRPALLRRITTDFSAIRVCNLCSENVGIRYPEFCFSILEIVVDKPLHARYTSACGQHAPLFESQTWFWIRRYDS